MTKQELLSKCKECFETGMSSEEIEEYKVEPFFIKCETLMSKCIARLSDENYSYKDCLRILVSCCMLIDKRVIDAGITMDEVETPCFTSLEEESDKELDEMHRQVKTMGIQNAVSIMISLLRRMVMNAQKEEMKRIGDDLKKLSDEGRLIFADGGEFDSDAMAEIDDDEHLDSISMDISDAKRLLEVVGADEVPEIVSALQNR